MIEALMLFGSAARGDVNENSDIDLLVVTSDGHPFSQKLNGIELQFMSGEKLVELAKSGDLFALHLALEGQIIFDFSGHLSRLKSCASTKNSYAKERQLAFDLAWFLLDFGEAYEPALVNKRVAWCVRTVTISLLAEKGEIAFSPTVLSERFPNSEVPFLIELRRSESQSHERMTKLKTFLASFDAARPKAKSLTEFIEYFQKTQNKVAVGTYRKLVVGANDRLNAYP